MFKHKFLKMTTKLNVFSLTSELIALTSLLDTPAFNIFLLSLKEKFLYTNYSSLSLTTPVYH